MTARGRRIPPAGCGLGISGLEEAYTCRRNDQDPDMPPRRSLAAACRGAHRALLTLQTGELRWYATSMVLGLVLMLAIMLRNAA